MKISADAIHAIETTISKGDRVEVIPVKDGVKVLRIRREVIMGADTKTGQVKQ